MTDLSCSGKMLKKTNINDDLSGQYVFMTFIDGQVKMAKNKRQIIKPLHLDVFYLKSGDNEMNTGFNYAMKDMQIAIQNLNEEEREKTFQWWIKFYKNRSYISPF